MLYVKGGLKMKISLLNLPKNHIGLQKKFRLGLKIGDIVTAKVLKSSSQLALLKIGGQKVFADVKTELTPDSEIKVRVTGELQNRLILKLLTDSSETPDRIEQLLEQYGIKSDADAKSALTFLLKNSLPLTQSTIKALIADLKNPLHQLLFKIFSPALNQEIQNNLSESRDNFFLNNLTDLQLPSSPKQINNLAVLFNLDGNNLTYEQNQEILENGQIPLENRFLDNKQSIKFEQIDQKIVSDFNNQIDPENNALDILLNNQARRIIAKITPELLNILSIENGIDLLTNKPAEIEGSLKTIITTLFNREINTFLENSSMTSLSNLEEAKIAGINPTFIKNKLLLEIQKLLNNDGETFNHANYRNHTSNEKIIKTISGIISNLIKSETHSRIQNTNSLLENLQDSSELKLALENMKSENNNLASKNFMTDNPQHTTDITLMNISNSDLTGKILEYLGLVVNPKNSLPDLIKSLKILVKNLGLRQHSNLENDETSQRTVLKSFLPDKMNDEQKTAVRELWDKFQGFRLRQEDSGLIVHLEIPLLFAEPTTAHLQIYEGNAYSTRNKLKKPLQILFDLYTDSLGELKALILLNGAEMNCQFAAKREKTRNFIRQFLPELKERLENNNFQVNQIGVAVLKQSSDTSEFLPGQVDFRV